MIWDYGEVRIGVRTLRASLDENGYGYDTHYPSVKVTPPAMRLIKKLKAPLILYADVAANGDHQYHSDIRNNALEVVLRGPSEVTTPKDSDVGNWHYDYSGWRYIGVWATNGATEMKSPDGIFKPQNRHLIVFDNDNVVHRVGRRHFDADTRFFIRLGFGREMPWEPAIDKLVKFS